MLRLDEKLAEKLEVLDELSSGAFGTLYRVRQLGLGRIAAMKVLRTNDDADLLSRLEQIVLRCLSKDPAKRYQTCKEVKSDIESDVPIIAASDAENATRKIWQSAHKSNKACPFDGTIKLYF